MKKPVTLSFPAGAKGQLTLTAGGHTETGPVRESNEDCFLCEPQDGLLAVADGMGGHIGGEIASRLALEGLRRGLLNGPPPRRELRAYFATAVFEELLEAFGASEESDDPGRLPDDPENDACDTSESESPPLARDRQLERTRLFQALLEGHVRVLDETRREPKLAGMGTTIVAAWMSQEDLWIGHVGDCRAYRWSEGKFQRLTGDHTPVAELIRAGRLDPSAERTHPMRSQLAQAIGAAFPPTPDVRFVRPQSGDTFILCSDGVWGALTDEELASCSSSDMPPDERAKKIVSAAIEAGSEDNATAVVLQFL